MGRAAAKDNLKQPVSTINDLAEKWQLQEVYDYISRELEPVSGLLEEVCFYLLSAPGKGIRPLLVLITSKMSSLNRGEGVRLAAAMEILHLATLVHDDVLDASMLRRGKPSVNSRWDDNIAILTGDFLFGKSLEMIHGFGEKINSRFAKIIIEVVSGEFMQAETAFDVSLKVKAYKQRISKKTAFMISNCCAMAAIVSGTPPEMVSCLESFGFYTGMAFQIQDDISDWCREEQDIGKPVTHDLQQGILTLPLVLALQLSEKKDDIERMVSSRNISREALAFIRDEIITTGSLDLARKRAFFYARQAEKCLNYFPNNGCRKDLEILLRNIFAKTPQKRH